MRRRVIAVLALVLYAGVAASGCTILEQLVAPETPEAQEETSSEGDE